ncbi:hypothetical protein [Roseibium sediminicola]|uniref:Uncharacterized protein n=1 Tax=Roseibium sediminicola TaxID=2933272 RepID=A0ABT0GS55_9HYPH|nr:hypothetical protein [Roseibium sp. CAU 1639]MCK7612279.1 hypothetical protein [Roseibium sp. CAU 1639]
MNWFAKALTFLSSAGLAVLPCATSAAAAGIDSAYTKIQLQNCTQVETASDEGTFAGAWQCPGYKDQVVYVAEGDLRMFISFGPFAADEPAASQTLPNFNTVNETLEWRLRGGVPFATILRWFPSLDDGARTGSILIVTQLQPGGGTCQIARVDAQANSNANVLARQAADTMAGNFDCSQPAQILGNPGALQW